MEILGNNTMPDFVHFYKKMLVLLFKAQSFNVRANQSECIKVESSDNVSI